MDCYSIEERIVTLLGKFLLSLWEGKCLSIGRRVGVQLEYFHGSTRRALAVQQREEALFNEKNCINELTKRLHHPIRKRACTSQTDIIFRLLCLFLNDLSYLCKKIGGASVNWKSKERKPRI